MDNQKLIKYILQGAAVIILLFFISSLVSLTNDDTRIRNKFDSKFLARTAYLDKFWKELKQKGKIVKAVDSSNANITQIVMSNRKDSQGVMMKWIQESNPNASFIEVTKLYQDMMRTIESNREKIFTMEAELADIVREQKDLITIFPNSFLFSTILGRKPIEYKPITSDHTDEIIKTGKDNDVSVF